MERIEYRVNEVAQETEHHTMTPRQILNMLRSIPICTSSWRFIRNV
jgi:hypothetical protein